MIVAAVTAITDLNADCLEKIFSYLNFDDMLNVADSNKWLKKGAELAFKKLKKTRVVLNAWTTDGDELRIKNLKTCIRVVRCFGRVISSLKVIYHDLAKHHRINLDRYIVKYYAATLTELHLWNSDKHTLKDAENHLQMLNVS